MAETLPASLAVPEVSRFVKRANQLRSIKPAIAYWCEYHAVNQIVAKSLHNTDDAAFDFTKTLIDRLESTKTERANDDAIVDNAAGQAYVEQFAQDTFDRAERALRANKVTRQTADTFDAAATFYDLGTEWGPLEPDVSQKIKFAKWNAARILRAIREGKDPNESNPKMDKEEDEAAAEEALDPNDPEVQLLTGTAPKPAAVEDAPDSGEPAVGVVNEPSPDISVPAQEGYFPPAPTNAPDAFIPSPLSQSPAPQGRPPASEISNTTTPYHQAQPPPAVPTQSFPTDTPPVPSPSAPSAPPSWTATPNAPPAQPPAPQQPVVPAWSPAPTPQPPQSQYAPPPPPVAAAGGAPSQKDIDRAQKHAKFAVSALNFDDVTTAVNELRTALAALKAI